MKSFVCRSFDFITNARGTSESPQAGTIILSLVKAT